MDESKGNAILVVGAMGGVGLELSNMLCARNYRVIATVRNVDQAAKLKNQVKGLHRVIAMDLSDANEVKSILDNALSTIGIPLVGAAVCAAVATPGPIETTPLDDLREILEINTVSNVAVYQAALPYLRESKGNLVMISSNAGRSGIPVLGYYVASKFALEGLADVMRREAANFGVKVSLIEPGGIDTGLQNKAWDAIEKGLKAFSQEEDRLYGYLYRSFKRQLHNAGAHMHPAQVAAVVVEALESASPNTRYQLGQDAIDIINMEFSCSDQEIDEFYRSVFSDSEETTPLTFTTNK